jgi:hypothetical protein
MYLDQMGDTDEDNDIGDEDYRGLNLQIGERRSDVYEDIGCEDSDTGDEDYVDLNLQMGEWRSDERHGGQCDADGGAAKCQEAIETAMQPGGRQSGPKPADGRADERGMSDMGLHDGVPEIYWNWDADGGAAECQKSIETAMQPVCRQSGPKPADGRADERDMRQFKQMGESMSGMGGKLGMFIKNYAVIGGADRPHHSEHPA